MKNLLTLLSLIIIFSFIIFIQSCKEENPAEPSPIDNEVVIPKTTKSIDSTDYSDNLISISNDSLIFTFKSEFVTKYNLAVNDVLVITKGMGLLRKITSMQLSGNEAEVTTRQATLTEAIEKGKISLKQSLQKASINKVDYFYEGIKYKLNKGPESNYDFELDIVLYDLDGDLNTTNDQVKLVGNCIIAADVIFEADIDFLQLQSGKIGLEAINSENLELIASLNYTLEKEITLATVHFTPIYYQLGPLPVIILIQFDIKVGGNGYANASLTVGFENTITYEAGINYVKGQGWGPYSVFSNQFDYNEPTLTANAGARVYVKPEISLAVYGVLAGYANAEAYGEILVDLLETPWWELYSGLDFGVGARAKIWSVEIFDYETNVLELRWLIAQASSSGNPPPAPTLSSPTDGATDISLPPTLIWNASTDATSYTLQVSTNSNFTSFDYNQIGLTETSQTVSGLNATTHYYWRVNAMNGNGTSGWSSVWNFTTESGGSGNGLIAYYPFNGNAHDSTGHGYNGTNHGVVFVADRFSLPGKAAHFSGGSSSYITTSNTGNIALNDTFSVCFWIKYENGGIIIEKDIVGTVNTDWHIDCDGSGKIGFRVGTAATFYTDGSVNDNVWHSIVLLRNRSNGIIRMYIDGQLDRQISGQTQNLTGTANINIGAWENPTSFNGGFTGSLDDVRFYTRELTESEIQLLYQGGL